MAMLAIAIIENAVAGIAVFWEVSREGISCYLFDIVEYDSSQVPYDWVVWTLI